MSRAADIAALVNKSLGGGTLRMASDPSLVVEYTSTGVLPFDVLLQGGMPSGRFVEVYGDYSTLKTWLGLQTIASYQRQGRVAALIDTEHAFDPSWATECGVNVKELIIWPPRDDDQIHTGEEAMDAAQMMLAHKVDFITFDSVASAFPQAEADKRLHKENIQPARLAMLMSTGLRRLTATNSRSTMMFINQTRLNIGVTFGSNESLPGGKALPFYASYRVAVRKAGKLTRDKKTYVGDKWQNGKEQHGQRFRAEVTKSKLSKPFSEIWFDWSLDDNQIDLVQFLINQGIEIGKVEVKGNTWSSGNVRAVGREKFKAKLKDDPDEQLLLENLIRDHHGIPLLKVPTQRGRTTKSRTSGGGRAPGKKKVLRRSV